MHLCPANTNLETIMFDPPHKMKNRSLTHTRQKPHLLLLQDLMNYINLQSTAFKEHNMTVLFSLEI